MPEMRESAISCRRQPLGQARWNACVECLCPCDSDHRVGRSLIEPGRVHDGLTVSLLINDLHKRAPLMQRFKHQGRMQNEEE